MSRASMNYEDSKDAEIARLRAGRALCQATLHQCREARDVAEAAIARVRELCAKFHGGPYLDEDFDAQVLRALDGAESNHCPIESCTCARTEEHE